MLTAEVTELQAALRRYLEQVQAGEDVVVSDRGKEIARLVPVQRPGPAMSDEYTDLVARGLLIPAKRQASPDDLRELPRLADPDGLLLKALLDEREGRI